MHAASANLERARFEIDRQSCVYQSRDQPCGQESDGKNTHLPPRGMGAELLDERAEICGEELHDLLAALHHGRKKAVGAVLFRREAEVFTHVLDWPFETGRNR